MNKKLVRLKESDLHRIIEESVKRVIKEHEEDWFDEDDEAYIGRTNAYYEDDDDSVFTPDYWTYDTTPDSKDFAGEVYKLTEDGKSELNYWIRCRRFNEYQRRNAFNPRNQTPEQEWELLTSSKQYSVRIR